MNLHDVHNLMVIFLLI